MVNRQKHGRTCGITAIANAYQWLGGKMSYEDAIGYCKRKKIRLNGMWPYEMAKILDDLGIDHEPVFNLNQDKMREILDEGHSVIYFYSWKQEDREGAHFVFIDGYSKSRFRAWNNSTENKTPWVSSERLSRYIRRTSKYCPELYNVSFIIKR